MEFTIRPGRRIYDEIKELLKNNPGVVYTTGEIEQALGVSRSRVYFALKHIFPEDRIIHKSVDKGHGGFSNIYWYQK